MNKLITFLALIMPLTISCVANGNVPGSKSYPVSPSAIPSASNSANNPLGNLKLGVLPDTSLSEDEQRLAGLISRKVKVEFPLKVGVLLYKTAVNFQDKNRKDNYIKYIDKLKTNPNISSVQEISASLTGTDSSVEDLRKLAARFQVSTLFIINDTYQSAQENKDSLITPIDIISGLRDWESTSNIEVFALDILNGVFVSTISSNISNSEKYNKNAINENKENSLTIKTMNNAWDDIILKTEQKIAEFKQQSGT